MLEKIFGDCTWLIIFEAAIGLLLFIGICRDLWISGVHAKGAALEAEVTRGEKSWQTIGLAWGLLSLITQQILQVSKAGDGYLVFLSVLNLSAFAYLCFLNGWFRNLIIDVAGRIRSSKELA